MTAKPPKAKEKLKVPAPNGKLRAKMMSAPFALPIAPPKPSPQIDKPAHLSAFPPSVVTFFFSTNRGDLPHDLYILDAHGNVVLLQPSSEVPLGGRIF